MINRHRGGRGRITLNLIENVSVIIGPFRIKLKSLTFSIFFNKIILLSQFTNSCLFIICVIVYNLNYCCYAKTSSSAVSSPKTSQQSVRKPYRPLLFNISLGSSSGTGVYKGAIGVIYPPKVLSLGKRRSHIFIETTLFLCICIFNITRGVFNFKSLISMVINILCSHIFSTISEDLIV